MAALGLQISPTQEGIYFYLLADWNIQQKRSE